jgi:hypothetical protein
MPMGPAARGQLHLAQRGQHRHRVEIIQVRPHRIGWAPLRKRVLDIGMPHCPSCGGGERRIIAAILERPVMEKILMAGSSPTTLILRLDAS